MWLFGSRANGKATELSDWDILAVMDSCTSEDAVLVGKHFRQDVDFFVNVEGANDFQTLPPSVPRSGSFSGWSWRQNCELKATYLSQTWISDQDEDDSLTTLGNLVERQCRALLVWRR